MPPLPAWPHDSGPKILTLVGNDLTIDVRARKTASSLARAGFSVISIGVDLLGTAPSVEDLDGALIYRVTPSLDPRVSTRTVRLSLPELRDWLRYRVEIHRQRLQMFRRNLTAWRHWNRSQESRLGRQLARAAEKAATAARLPKPNPLGIGQKILRRVSLLRFVIRHSAKRYRVLAVQLRYVLTTDLYKAAARASARAWRPGAWRRDLPELHRYEAAIGPLVDYLQPDLIHVHDIFHLGLAARAKARAADAGSRMLIVYDAHELVAGLPTEPRRRAALTQLEEEYVHNADAVVTVSPSLAQALRDRYGVSPSVVMNAPDASTVADTDPIRALLGLDESQKLIVYVGGVAAHRGAEEMVRALALLDPKVHLALVSNSTTGYVRELARTAEQLGAADRFHLVPYVAPEAVVAYLTGCDVSVIPLSRDVPNYEVALPNKLLQSIHARVPVVVSDNPEMARFVNEHGVGEVYAGGNVEAMVTAICRVLEDHSRYLDAITPELLDLLSWPSQARELLKVYAELGVSPA